MIMDVPLWIVKGDLCLMNMEGIRRTTKEDRHPLIIMDGSLQITRDSLEHILLKGPLSKVTNSLEEVHPKVHQGRDTEDLSRMVTEILDMMMGVMGGVRPRQ